MNQQTLLHVNSSGRQDGSITRQVSNRVATYLKQKNPELNIVGRDVASGLPFVHEAWINANFTPADDRSVAQKEVLSFSDELVRELDSAQQVIIASPVYNFSIPATLKTWVDMIARVGLTFKYTETGPVGLLEDKKAILVMASGGVPIGSEMDMASRYLKFFLGFVGINDVTVIDATTFDLSEMSLEASLSQIKGVLNA